MPLPQVAYPRRPAWEADRARVCKLLRAVLFSMVGGRFIGMFGCMGLMAMRSNGVVCGLLVVARFMVGGRLGVVFSRFFVVFGGLFVRCSCFFRHDKYPSRLDSNVK